MPKVTFEADEELKRIMNEHPEVNWSEVFRRSIRRHARTAELAEQIIEEESDPRVQAVAEALKTRTARRFRRTKNARRS
jgi:ferritin-like protein